MEDEGWHKAEERYKNFQRTRDGRQIMFLELGVGYNMPVTIKYPFWQMTDENERATYVCVSFGQAYAPREIAERSVCLDADIGRILSALNRKVVS